MQIQLSQSNSKYHPFSPTWSRKYMWQDLTFINFSTLQTFLIFSKKVDTEWSSMFLAPCAANQKHYNSFEQPPAAVNVSSGGQMEAGLVQWYRPPSDRLVHIHFALFTQDGRNLQGLHIIIFILFCNQHVVSEQHVRLLPWSLWLYKTQEVGFTVPLPSKYNLPNFELKQQFYFTFPLSFPLRTAMLGKLK